VTVAPPATVIIPAIAPALVALRDCLCNELVTTGGGDVCWCGVWTGADLSWEFCEQCDDGKCGMAYVRLATVYPYAIFPVPVVDLTCINPLAYQIEMGVVRCFPTMGPDGELPDADAITDAAVTALVDMAAMYRALTCCGQQVAPEAYQPVGPSGGCSGGFWTAYVTPD
jgi:hypothetical protein